MKIEIRSDNSAEISGYVNVVGRESRVLHDRDGAFVEIIKPKTFDRALSKNNNVGLMFNHQRDVQKDKLDLYEDNIGLFARAIIHDDEIIRQAKADKLQGWSFGFYVNQESVSTRDDGVKLRTIEDIDLIEVSILDVTPAYIATSIEMRDDKALVRQYRNADEKVEKVIEEPAPNELMLRTNSLKTELEFLKLKFVD